MQIYKLKLYKTYYNNGFFNVPVDFDKYVQREDGPIIIIIDGREIDARVDHRANLNGTARVFGRSELRDWFQSNFDMFDIVNVEFESPRLIRLYI
ncbi:MAG: hypothetical protein FVQ83_10205 [Chloroflexi bacterium]|nr:hypothetical protein [Chloroflexota bacterium]